MINRRVFAKVAPLLSALFVILFLFNSAKAQDGKALFANNCASCHAVWKDATGPALNGVEGRWPSKELLYTWIKNWKNAVATGDAYAVKIQNYSATQMNLFPQLQDKDIDAILGWIAKEPNPKDIGGTKDACLDPNDPSIKDKSNDNSMLYGILTMVLGIIALTLLYVNSNLRKMSDDKEGTLSAVPVPFYRNKTYLLLFALVAFIGGGFNIGKDAINLGRNKDYQPEQPIYYSHKVHAGLNQINCLYCHTGAQEGKQATLPSLNTCMNCHMNIKEYNGCDMFREDGTKVNGTAEIKKLYEYADFSGAAGATWNPATAKATAIPWVKIHNLADHVYFNHSQHVKVGQIECQKCHGEIQEMGEVKQHSDLSMGWCINCHRETGVQFSTVDSTGKMSGNGFYEQYTKLHDDMKKNGKVTVGNIGGTECQKCHY
jgi:mono/diheme cytochrome c family protein